MWTKIGLLPLHTYIIELCEQLPSKAYACGMDNLHNSAKFFK